MPHDAGRTLKSEQDRGPQLRDECAISKGVERRNYFDRS
jgi:hypothetical protein